MDLSPLALPLAVLAGLYPVLHPNTVVELLPIAVEVLVGLYIPLSILPSMALSYHSESFSFFPAHRLYRAGFRGEVVGWWILSSSIGVVLALLLRDSVEGLFHLLYPLYPIALPLLSAVILHRLGWRGVVLFLLYGAVGWLLFRLPLKDPLLVLFSGLFALPSLLGRPGGAVGRERGPAPADLLPAGMGALLSALLLTQPGIGSPSAALALLALFLPLGSWSFLSANASYLGSQMVLAFQLREDLGVARVGTALHLGSFDVNLFLMAFSAGSVLAWALLPFLERLYSRWVQGGLLLLLTSYIASTEGVVGLLFFAGVGALALLHRQRGLPAFPFFGSLIVPTLVRGLERLW